MNDRHAESAAQRLERHRLRINQRLDAQRERVNDRFDKRQAALDGRLNARQEQIVAAALELLSEKQLNDLSLRDVAEKLTIKAPALYWYFKNKSELVDNMAEVMLSRQFGEVKPRAEGQSWQHWLTANMKTLRRAMLAYPDGGRVVAGAHIRPARTLAQLFESCIVSLTTAGIDEQSAFYAAMAAVQFTFGFVIEEQSGPDPDRLAAISPLHQRELEASYPALARAGKDYNQSVAKRDKAYAAVLQLIIRGIEAEQTAKYPR